MDLFIATTIGLSLTLGLAALGGLFSERSGIINIGIEGMMTAGALIWTLSGVYMKDISNNMQIISFLLAAFLGMVLAMLHGLVSITLRGNQIISGTAINMLILGISLFIISGSDIGGRPGQIVSSYRIIGFASTGLWSQVSVLSIGVIVIFICAYWLLRKSSWGLKLRTVGENPTAAEAVGINVIAKRYQALAFSGTLAGVGGGFFAQYLGGTFFGSVQGYGFLALGILIFGQWKVKYVGLATILFSSLSVFALVGQTQFKIEWLQQVPSQLLQTLPFVGSLTIMIVSSKTMAIPQALGRPYKKSRSN